jgi:hypothetical protein
MKFTLTYQGELRANDDFRRKWEIRNHFHPQLAELWRISPTLQRVWRQRSVPPDGWLRQETHHSLDSALSEDSEHITMGRVEPQIDLCAPIVVAGRRFRPLVRDSYALQCGLDITFLRKEEPGHIYQGGDLDNRLKTLLDALAVPNEQQIVDEDTEEGHLFCLMENDRLVSSLNVRTHRLLGAQNVTKHHVSLIIEVDVRVAQSRLYNQPFLGD